MQQNTIDNEVSNSCKRKFEKTSSPSRFVKVELIFEQLKLRHYEKVTKFEKIFLIGLTFIQ